MMSSDITCMENHYMYDNNYMYIVQNLNKLQYMVYP